MNVKTTVSGFIAAVAPWLKTVLPAEFGAVVDAVATIALAAFAYFAADKAKAQ